MQFGRKASTRYSGAGRLAGQCLYIEALNTVMASVGAFPLMPTAKVYGRPSQDLFNSTEGLGVVVYDHFQRK